MIPLSRPDITETEVQEVLSVLRTPMLSMGPKVREFEERMAALLGVRYSVAVSSGTAGLHLAIWTLGIGPGMEVLTTPFSFVASANAVLFERAVPVFVDIDRQTLNLTPQTVEAAIEERYRRTDRGLVSRATGRRLAALLPVDVFGHPMAVEGFRALARRYHLALIEDACEALGSEVYLKAADRWVSVGSQADIAVFAFYPNKQLTTGEGGLVVTNDETLAARIRMGRNQGRAEGATWLEHETLGFNYRLDELSAALGVAQVKRVGELVRKRRAAAARYNQALGGIEGLSLPYAEAWARVNWFVYVVRVSSEVNRDALGAFLRTRGIETRVYFPPIHLQPYHRQQFGFGEGAFPESERAAAATLALPFFNDLTDEQIADVARGLEEGVKACAAVGYA